MQSCFLGFEFFLLKKNEKATRHSRRSKNLPGNTLNSTCTPQFLLLLISIPTQTEKIEGRINKIVVGTVVKAKIDELEEEVREGFLREIRKELTGVTQGVSAKKKFLVMFKDGRKKYLTSSQLIIVILAMSLV